MLKALLYKEWLKTRWAMIIYLCLGILMVAYIFLDLKYDLKMVETKHIWYSVLFNKLQYYSLFKFVPLLGGITLGIAQYIPEISSKRIKLSLHLPVKEEVILLQMMSYGTLVLIISYLCLLSLFMGLSSLFFPAEINVGAFISMVPWFLSGYAVYYLVGVIVMEPIWKFRIGYLLFSVFFLRLFFQQSLIAAYGPINLPLVLLTFALSITLLFTTNRFRKGVQQ